uniref:Uncharacterized protein n=1 Tax=Ananas comosus var. bracteatus TaxID=296719 RepID=A0A6V7NGT6_ANACO|nr:unnamed protein product [Ananas comosus var. bracteatus]
MADSVDRLRDATAELAGTGAAATPPAPHSPSSLSRPLPTGLVNTSSTASRGSASTTSAPTTASRGPCPRPRSSPHPPRVLRHTRRLRGRPRRYLVNCVVPLARLFAVAINGAPLHHYDEEEAAAARPRAPAAAARPSARRPEGARAQCALILSVSPSPSSSPPSSSSSSSSTMFVVGGLECVVRVA